jgi:hypothetical protein
LRQELPNASSPALPAFSFIDFCNNQVAGQPPYLTCGRLLSCAHSGLPQLACAASLHSTNFDDVTVFEHRVALAGSFFWVLQLNSATTVLTLTEHSVCCLITLRNPATASCLLL